MADWTWKAEEDFDSIVAEKGTAGVGGPERYFIKWNEHPYKAIFEDGRGEDGEAVIELSAFLHPDLVMRSPGIFNIEYRFRVKGQDRYSLHSFYEPREVERWLKDKGIEGIPDFEDVRRKMGDMYVEIIETCEKHGYSAFPDRIKCC